MRTPKYFCIFSVLLLTLTFSSCGSKTPNSFIQDVNWESVIVEDDLWLRFSAQFNLGTMTMTSVELPIFNPKNPSIQYGSVAFRPTLDGHSEIETSINLSASAHIGASLATLPNGRELPIAGLENVDIYQLNIDSIHSRVYLGLNHSTFLFGFAVSIKEFDHLSKSVGGMLNFFPGFYIKGVRGMLGFYTGNESYTSGLAFFVDLSKLFSPDILNNLINGKPASAIATRSAINGIDQNELISQTPAYSNKSSLKFPKGTPKLTKKSIKALKTLSDMSKNTDGIVLNPVQE